MRGGGYSANRLAKAIGVPQTTLSRQLRLKAVPLESLEKAATVLGVDIQELLGIAESGDLPAADLAQLREDLRVIQVRAGSAIRLLDRALLGRGETGDLPPESLEAPIEGDRGVA